MKNIFRKLAQKYFTSYRGMLFLYVLIFLIPFIVISYFVQGYFFNLVKQNTINKETALIINEMRNLDKLNETFLSIRNQMTYDSSIKDSYHPYEYLEANQLRDKLSLLSISQSEIVTIWYYCTGDDYMYSSQSSQSLKYLTQSRYQAFDISPDEFRSILENNGDSMVIKAYDTYIRQNVILFLFPVIRGPQKNNHQILYSVLTETLNHYLFSLSGGNPGSFALYDATGNQLTFWHNDSNTPDQDFESISSIIVESNQLTYDNVTLTFASQDSGPRINVVRANSLISGWSVLMVTRNVYADSLRMQYILLISLASVLVFGLMLIMAAANLNYMPIRFLRNKVKDFTDTEEADPNVRKHTGENDFFLIDSFIDLVSNENVWLKQNIANNRSALKDYLVFNLLNNKINTIEDFNRPGSVLDLHLEPGYFRVVTVIFDFDEGVDSNVPLDAMCDLLEIAAAETGLIVIHRRLSSIYGMAVVVSYQESQKHAAKTYYRYIEQKAREQIVTPFVIGIGRETNCFSDIPVCYMQSLVSCNDILFRFDGLSYEYDKSPELPDSPVSVLAFRDAVHIQDQSGMAQELSSILTILNSNQLTFYDALVTAYCIFHLYVDAIRKINLGNIVIESPTSLVLINTHSKADIIKSLNFLHHVMNQNLLEASSAEKINPVDQIKHYIVSHFDDPAFSIKSLASHFSMSVSSLSTFFKFNAGVQLIDFITDLRINKATELLQNSNLTISEIGMSIGYFNANAFIRRFKQVIGVTPGEYRRQSNIDMQ